MAPDDLASAPQSASAWLIDRRSLRFVALVSTVLIGLATIVAGSQLRTDAPTPTELDRPDAATPDPGEGTNAGADSADTTGTGDTPDDEMSTEPIPVAPLVLLGAGALLLVVGAIAWLARRNDEPGPEDHDQAQGVTSSAEAVQLLDHLMARPAGAETPRQTILRIYGELEQGLNRAHLARRAHETPGVFVQRILGHHDALRRPLGDLVRAFELARFSEHEVTEAMRDDAIAALAQTRSHYAMHEVQASGPRRWDVHHAALAPVGAAR